MVASFNWTVVASAAVTGLTAIVVGAIGYYSSRLTADVTKGQMEAETRRAELAQAEAHLQQRQGIYHDLLNSERRAAPVVTDVEAPEEQRINALHSIYDHVNGAILFGTRDVANRAIELANVLRDIEATVAFGEEVPSEIHSRWISARRNVIDAMRVDVSVDRERPAWSPLDDEDDAQAVT